MRAVYFVALHTRSELKLERLLNILRIKHSAPPLIAPTRYSEFISHRFSRARRHDALQCNGVHVGSFLGGRASKCDSRLKTTRMVWSRYWAVDSAVSPNISSAFFDHMF